jgi:hypothetical protein
MGGIEMKHNIIISGVPRAGKTTLAHMLSLQGFHHIAMDAIIAGFETCFPDLGINTYQNLTSLETLHVISGKIAPFINAMFECNEYKKFAHGIVIDIYQLLPSDFNRYIDPKYCDAYWLGTADVTPEERLAIQRKYDTEQDYSFYKTDELLCEGSVYQVEQSNLFREQCAQYGYRYFDTAYDRENVLKQAVKDILHDESTFARGKYEPT